MSVSPPVPAKSSNNKLKKPIDEKASVDSEQEELFKELGSMDPRLQPAYQHRSGTFEKKPEIMQGTINFLLICHVIYAVQKLVFNYYDRGQLLDMSLAWWLLRDTHIAILVLIAMILWCVSVFYWITHLHVHNKIPGWLGVALYVVSQAVLYAGPLYIVFKYDFSPLLSGATCMQMAVWSMKMHSYWWTNLIMQRRLTESQKRIGKKPVREHSLPWTQFIYFMMAPTLIYELTYPRTKRINWLYFFGLFVQTWACFFVIYLIIVEDLIPIYSSSPNLPIIRACLALALPSFSVWMVLFYCLFHCILGMMAELTRFADREFFQDWWNATSFDAWWRRWNRPVHKWMLRHIYLDSMQTVKYDKDSAALATFAISALAHEFVLAVAFRMVRPILFTTMILQIGLTYLTKLPAIQGTELGNFIMWVCLLIGQPIVQILYAREYYRNLHNI